MATYAVWFEGNRVKKVENVTEQFKELFDHLDGDLTWATFLLAEELGASAVVGGNTVNEAVAEAAKICGIDEIEDWPGDIGEIFRPYWA